jgi:hypothetical protein
MERAPKRYPAVVARCEELSGIVAGIEIGLGLAPGSLDTAAKATQAMETFMARGVINPAAVERNAALHSMVSRLSERYPAPLAGSTLFDQLAELVESVLQKELQ